MRVIKTIDIVAGLLPFLAFAGPVAADNSILKRGVDMCHRTASAGDLCNHGRGDDQPYICGRNDYRAIVSKLKQSVEKLNQIR